MSISRGPVRSALWTKADSVTAFDDFSWGRTTSAMKWITRERPKIDRIACPWLVARFIDRAPEFLFVPAAEVIPLATETGAIPYDVPGVELTHVAERCSFDAFIQKYALCDPALDRLALIVRGADTSRLDLAPEAPGLFAISQGLVAKLQRRSRDAAPWNGDLRRAVHVVRRTFCGTAGCA